VLPDDNPFAAASTLTDQYPPFDRIRIEHYRPAFEEGFAEQRAEIEAITGRPDPPTFGNTVEALERSGALLRRVRGVFENLLASDSNEEMRDLDAVLAPLLSAHRDRILLDAALFARLQAVHEHRHDVGLDPEQVDLVERVHRDFARAGAALDPESQRALRELNARLAELASVFASRLLADTADLALHLTDVADLDGLTPEAVAGAAAAAEARGLEGYLLTLGLPTSQPVIANLASRDVRRRLHEASVSRGLRGNDNDTRAILAEMVDLRARRAALLGYPSHAAYVVADRTAGSVEAVEAQFVALAGPAARNLERERADLERTLHEDGHDGPLMPWDWAYYAERLRRQRHALDEDLLRPYFTVQRVLEDGVFEAAQRLYGLSFARRDDLPLPHPDAEVFEVADGTGAHLGLFVCDWFARDSKQGGAWMGEFVTQSRLLGTRPVVTVTLNVPKPPTGKPALMTSEEVTVAFHEFGHALHGLLSDCTYARTSGTDVPRDFVEFPSQVNEMWAWWPSVLASYAVHHETGEPIPQVTVERLLAARSYGQGFKTFEQLAAAALDWEWHVRTVEDGPVPARDVEAFERAALEKHGLASEVVPPRYRSTYFQHVFDAGDDSYAAGYYGYMWSEVLDADTVEWFKENGGLQRANGDRFRGFLLSRGDTVDVMAATRELLGREPRLEPFLVRRGLA
jgi:peptidyl-dipeptidase Dcp